MIEQALNDPDRAPDLIEPLIGYRFFHLRNGKLHSAFWHRPVQRYHPGPNRAACDMRKLSLSGWVYHGRCEHPAGQPAPAPKCTCGIYANHRIPGWFGSDDGNGVVVLAAVAASGLIEIYRDGFRAQELEVVCLADYPAPLGLHRVAAEYGVPVVPVSRLRDVALEHGVEAPSTLIPSSEDFPIFVRRRNARIRRLGLTLAATAATTGAARVAGVKMPLYSQITLGFMMHMFVLAAVASSDRRRTRLIG